MKSAAVVSPIHEANSNDRQRSMTADENGVQKQNLDTEPSTNISAVTSSAKDTSETTEPNLL